MGRRKAPPAPNVFTEAMGTPLAAFPPAFLRMFVELNQRHSAGVEPAPYGRELDSWVQEVKRNPHVLPIDCRAVLLSIPGFTFSRDGKPWLFRSEKQELLRKTMIKKLNDSSGKTRW